MIHTLTSLKEETNRGRIKLQETAYLLFLQNQKSQQEASQFLLLKTDKHWLKEKVQKGENFVEFKESPHDTERQQKFFY